MGALTRVRQPNFGPWWLWSIVVILALVAGYAGYIARFSNERLAEAASAFGTLDEKRAELSKALLDISDRLKQANEREEKARAEADALSAIVAKLQKRSDGLQAELDGARKEAKTSAAAADEFRKKAAGADAAFEQVRGLQKRLTSLKAEADAANAATATSSKEIERLMAETRSAADAKAALEREAAELRNEISELRRKLEAEAQASAAQPQPTPTR
jgi:chromosome segregation ATPase